MRIEDAEVDPVAGFVNAACGESREQRKEPGDGGKEPPQRRAHPGILRVGLADEGPDLLGCGDGRSAMGLGDQEQQEGEGQEHGLAGRLLAEHPLHEVQCRDLDLLQRHAERRITRADDVD